MASASAVPMATLPAAAGGPGRLLPGSSRPLGLAAPWAKPGGGRPIRLQVRASAASVKDKAVAGLTAAATAAALVIPEVAEAAGPGLSPSLKNFLLSIVAGGVVLAVILGAVIGVANFDPVKRS